MGRSEGASLMGKEGWQVPQKLLKKCKENIVSVFKGGNPCFKIFDDVTSCHSRIESRRPFVAILSASGSDSERGAHSACTLR